MTFDINNDDKWRDIWKGPLDEIDRDYDAMILSMKIIDDARGQPNGGQNWFLTEMNSSRLY